MTVFTHGVASGDPMADRVMLWTRARPDDGRRLEVAWAVSADPGLRRAAAAGMATAEPTADHVARVDVRGLDPGRTYHYGFRAGDDASPVGTTRTLPGGHADRIRFAVFSCAKYSAGYFNAIGRIADRDDLDFVLCLGDYIYEYSNRDKGLGAAIGRPMEPDHRCVSLEDYRTRYAQARADPDMQRLHLRHPIVPIPDDHEIADNAWRDGAKKHEPGQDGDWRDRKRAALRAWREWMPARVPTDDPATLWRAFPVGSLADLIVLDTRTRRDRQAHPPESDDPHRTLLGPEQKRWLAGSSRGRRPRGGWWPTQ